MNYFEVYEERAETLTAHKINSDGSYTGDHYTISEREPVGYRVYEYEEDGEPIGESYYAIGGFYADPEDALEQIKADHPAGEWQNHDW